MSKYFKYLFSLLVVIAFITKSNDNLPINSLNDSLEPTHYSQLSQKNNDVAIQIETQNVFVEHISLSYLFKFQKSFSCFFSTSFSTKELLFSFFTNLYEKILNNTLVCFSNTQIIYPFHSFW